MSLSRESTIASSIEFEGVGLHTGEQARVTLRPAVAGSGVNFFRTDLSDASDAAISKIGATPDAVCCTRLGTALKNDAGAMVRTAEHLLAAIAICEIDNICVDVAGREIPILDGSASTFVELIDAAGRIQQNAARRPLTVMKPIEVRDGDRYIRATPFSGRRLDVSISFPDGAIGDQSMSIDLDDAGAARRRLAPARTFCRLQEVQALRQAGYGLGGSMENAIVVDGDAVLNPSGLRDDQEFALHKALDLIGDLRLAGATFIGWIEAHKCGHDINTAFAAKLLKTARLDDARPATTRRGVAALSLSA